MKDRVLADSNTHDWDFTQCFGDRSDIDNITESDIISAVEFDPSGDFLATGDRGGRIVLFKKEDSEEGEELYPSEYRFYTEFQSHDREFDYLKSLEIEEKINQIRWCHPTNNANYLLSTNDKTIKLWKIFEKEIKVVAENNGTDRLGQRSFGTVNMHDLKLPRMNLHDRIIASAPRRTYANAHAYHINSLSVNSDMETFLSSDDLRINLWNLQEQDRSFNIVDIRPASMEELTEVVTAVECHPSKCNEFIYSTCKGSVKLADMRDRALCDQYSKCFVDPLEAESESFFTEITSSISDIKYANDGRHIIARDFMTVKIWDVAMERCPVETIHVHDNIKQFLCTSYETDSIFDKFEVEVSGDGNSIMTGSYSSNFFIYPNALAPFEQQVHKRQRREVDFENNPNNLDVDMDMDMDLDSDHEDANVNLTASEERQSRSLSSPLGLTRIRRARLNDLEDDQFEYDDRDVVTLTADKNVFEKHSLDERARLHRRNQKKVDFRKNILHMSWHPYDNTVAIAATNNLFVFSA